MEVRKVRDLTLVDIDNKSTLVIACDSCGSVGMKESDVLKVPPYYTGRFTARVALMEVMCAGAEVITITDTVCCEMEPTGREIIRGIEEELDSAGIAQAVLTGSTEENFPTYATGLGITVIGVADKASVKVNVVEEGCLLLAIGKPKVGKEIDLEDDTDIASYKQIKELLKNPSVKEIVPVGSKGILYEAQEIAKNNNLSLKTDEGLELKIDVTKSCGPATVILAAVKKDKAAKLLQDFCNINIIGSLV